MPDMPNYSFIQVPISVCRICPHSALCLTYKSAWDVWMQVVYGGDEKRLSLDAMAPLPSPTQINDSGKARRLHCFELELYPAPRKFP